MLPRQYWRAFAHTRILAACVLLFVLSPARSLRAEDESFIAYSLSYCEKVITSLRERLVPEAKSPASVSDPDEINKQAVLNRLMKSIFLNEKGYYFTQSQWGAKPIPYQLDRLEFLESEGRRVTPTDLENGIEERSTFAFKAKAYRIFDEVKGWGPWEPGLPPNLDTVSLVKQDGIWKISTSPEAAYSLR